MGNIDELNDSDVDVHANSRLTFKNVFNVINLSNSQDPLLTIQVISYRYFEQNERL